MKTFEESVKELEKTVQALEKGDLSLEESIQAFEKGIELSKTCNDILDKAEKRINILVGNGEELTEQNFIPEE